MWNEGGYLVFVINIFSVLYVNCFKKLLKKKYFNSETTHSLIVINKSIQVIFIDLFPLKKISKNWINKQLVGNFLFQAMFIIYEVHRKLIYLLTLVPLLQVHINTHSIVSFLLSFCNGWLSICFRENTDIPMI